MNKKIIIFFLTVVIISFLYLKKNIIIVKSFEFIPNQYKEKLLSFMISSNEKLDPFDFKVWKEINR